MALASVVPASAGDLRMAAAALPPGLGNPFTGVNQPGSEIWLSIYDALTILDWGKDATPGLALSWTMTAPTRWEFRLRPGVTFHNGKPFTAADVVGTYQILHSAEGAGFLVAGEVQNISGMRALNPMTLEIETRAPDAILPKRLATMMIVDPDHWRAVGAGGSARAPVGTGPFRLRTWGPGDKAAELDANPASWRVPVAVTRLRYRVIVEHNARVQALLSDQADVASGLQIEDIADLEARGLKAHIQPNPQLKSIAFRTVRDETHALQDVRVRRALNHAVDRDSIAGVIMLGHVAPIGQAAPPGLTGHNPEVAPYRYDPARARALLAEAGYARGLKLNFDVVTQNATPDALIFQKIAQDLAAVGVAAELRSITFADYQVKYASGRWGDADGFSQTWNNAAYQDPIRAIEYFSCLKPNPFFCAPALMPAIAAINAEVDLARREDLLKTYMARLHDAAPAIWITNAAYVVGHTDAVPAVTMLPTGVAFERLRFSAP